MKHDALVLLLAGAGLFAVGFGFGRIDNAGAVRDARRAQFISDRSADSLAWYIAHRKCWYDPVPRAFWHGEIHR